MKNKLSALLISSVLAISLTSAPAFALTHAQKDEHFMPHKFKKMAQYLDLNDTQRDQTKIIHQEAKESRLALKESLKIFHQQSKILTMEERFNEQAYSDLQAQYQQTFTQMALIKAKTKNQFINILTEEQREKMKSHKRFGKKRSHLSK
jgi:Spy/CpxP family protein refolding chaperone